MKVKKEWVFSAYPFSLPDSPYSNILLYKSPGIVLEQPVIKLMEQKDTSERQAGLQGRNTIGEIPPAPRSRSKSK